MPIVKVAFFVPIKDNDGRPLQAEIDDLEMELITIFVGWTFQRYVRGYYRKMDGTRCMDVNASYFIALDESRINELENILHSFLSKTLQEALYLEIHDKVEIR